MMVNQTQEQESSAQDADSPVRRGAIQSGDMVRQMFNRIVPRYDLMNRVMTGGRDVAWRNIVAKQAATHGDHVLDIATGTGDLAFATYQAGAKRVVGADFSEEMIEAARKKAPKHGPDVQFMIADALNLPFDAESFDAATVAFGLRNMSDYDAALREMYRVLRPGGEAIILEMTPFKRPILGPPFRFYFGRVVPVVGGVLSGDITAYRYLPSSVDAFPPAHELAEMMQEAGFADVRYQLLGFGTVAIHSGTRPAQG
ncbi:MAG TPA: bifunctional demethylmenaquinone methyltransferase/2-methoxy-6-polyprenyl-1,4-benzoquinol methylase UbiE [Thermomicrobiales bacterium]|nr:bifunctional demethylmenaquinone methyltransferase/2-methoxy-6-polyprenyl-1,4-benzoquinol methylase UbiE [Thermomicrobiales bacterium]